MIKNIIIEGLKYALDGVSEWDQNIFENLKMREEVENNVTTTEENNNNQGREGGCQECSAINASNDGNAGRENEGADSEERNAQVGCNSTSGRIQYRRETNVQVLTRTGKKFVNNILDGYHSEKANIFDFTNQFRIGEFLYPNLNVFKLVNVTRRNFYNADAELLSGQEKDYYIVYPGHCEYEDIDFELHEDNDMPEFMDPDEFERTWKRIIRVSSRIGSDTQVNTKLSKPVTYLNDIKCAYTNDGLAVKYSETPTYDEYMFAHLMKPWWKGDVDRFTRIDSKVPRFDRLDVMEWLFKTPGNGNKSNTNSSNNEGDKATKWKKKNNNNNGNRKGKNNNNNGNKNSNANNPNQKDSYQAEQSSDDKKQHDK